MTSLLHRIAASITREVLDGLVENGAHESQQLDYKQSLTLEGKEQKKDFLADICAFANTDGGDILVGIRSEKGVPVEITGMSNASVDSLRNKIEQILEHGLSPRLTSVQVVPILVGNDAIVLLIRVPKSWNAPHRVEVGHERFYKRTSGRKHLMDVDELRAAFGFGDNFRNRLNALHRQMFAAIPEKIPDLSGQPFVSLHLIPYSALGSPRTPGQSSGVTGADLRPLGAKRNFENRSNFDGLLTTYPSEGKVEAFTQLYRDAIVESARTLKHLRVDTSEGPQGLLATNDIAARLILATERFLGVQARLGVSGPVGVFASLLGVLGCTIRDERRNRFSIREDILIDRDVLHLPEIVAEQVPRDRDALKSAFRDPLDRLWNAAGWPRSLLYDEHGQCQIDESWFVEQ
jgi:hypothetical protein